MSDPSTQSGENLPTKKPDDTGMPLIIYILYLVGLVIGITALVGVIMAYVQKGNSSTFIESHFQFQIRTFWIGLVGSIIGGLLIPVVGIGFLVLLALAIWYIIRCVKGIMWLQNAEAVPDPTSWLFGSAKS